MKFYFEHNAQIVALVFEYRNSTIRYASCSTHRDFGVFEHFILRCQSLRVWFVHCTQFNIRQIHMPGHAPAARVDCSSDTQCDTFFRTQQRMHQNSEHGQPQCCPVFIDLSYKFHEVLGRICMQCSAQCQHFA